MCVYAVAVLCETKQRLVAFGDGLAMSYCLHGKPVFMLQMNFLWHLSFLCETSRLSQYANCFFKFNLTRVLSVHLGRIVLSWTSWKLSGRLLIIIFIFPEDVKSILLCQTHWHSWPLTLQVKGHNSWLIRDWTLHSSGSVNHWDFLLA